MKNEEVKNNQVNETAPAEEKKEVIETKTRLKIHIRNPFVAEKVECPVKGKKEKKAKEPKDEKEPKKNKYGLVFGLGYAAGVASAAAGELGKKRYDERKKKSDEDEDDDDEELEDDLDDSDVDSEDSEDSDE